MDRTGVVSRHVSNGWRDKNISDRQSKGTTALGQEPLGWLRALRWDLGTARRTRTYPSAGNGYPAVADAGGRHRFDHSPIAGDLHRAPAEEGIQRDPCQRCLAHAGGVRCLWTLGAVWVGIQIIDLVVNHK